MGSSFDRASNRGGDMLEAMTKEQAITEILQLMEQYGLSLEDIFEPETAEVGEN